MREIGDSRGRENEGTQKASRKLGISRRLEADGRGAETLEIKMRLSRGRTWFLASRHEGRNRGPRTLSGDFGARSSSMTVCWYTSSWGHERRCVEVSKMEQR